MNASMDAPPWSVAIFAHNEAQVIERCLASLNWAAPGRRLRVTVLANGCRDDTVARVRAFASEQLDIHVVEIELGDKCNAWNQFLHRHWQGKDDTVFFMDGDVEACPDALIFLADGLAKNPRVLVTSSLPASGRSRQAHVSAAVSSRGLFGGLYAVRGEWLVEARRRGLRLPVGFVREDGLICAMAKFDLAPECNPWDDARVLPVLTARFLFDSVPLLSAAGWRKYWNRRLRYSRGHFEFKMLRPLMVKGGIQAIPESVQTLYRSQAVPEPAFRGMDTVFDWLACREIQRLRDQQRLESI